MSSDRIVLGDIDLDSPFEIESNPPSLEDIAPQVEWKDDVIEEPELQETDEILQEEETPVLETEVEKPTEEVKSDEDPIYITALSLVEKGLLKEDQVKQGIDYVEIRDTLVKNIVDGLDQEYNVDERVNQVAENLGFTKQAREYLDYLMAGGSEHNVINAAKYERLLALATDTDDEASERNVNTKLSEFLKDKGVDPEIIADNLATIHSNGRTDEYLKRADQHFTKRKNDLIVEDQKRVEAERAEQARVELEKNELIRKTIRSGKLGDIEIDASTIPQFERDVFALTEDYITEVNGKRQIQKVSKIQKMLWDAFSNPAKAAEFYYKILYTDKRKETTAKAAVSENEEKLRKFVNRQITTTETIKKEKPYVSENRRILGTLQI